MSVTKEDFLTSLIDVRDWNSQFALIKAWVSDGQIDLLLEIAEVLISATCPDGIQPMVRQSMVYYMLRRLALTPGNADVAMMLSALLSENPFDLPTMSGGSEADIASQLAFGQPQDELQALFPRHGTDPRHQELPACLVQEMILRGMDVTGSEAATFFEREMKQRLHPLGLLPLALLPPERLLKSFLPHYGPRSESHSMPDWEEVAQSGEVAQSSDIPATHTIQWISLTGSEENHRRLQSAVQNWQNASNGKIESGIFCSNDILTAGVFRADAVQLLPLECFRGATLKQINVRTVSIERALTSLFCAASQGGAYNSGLGGAYGRLAAWNSMSGFIGSDEAASVRDIATLAESCTWLTFRAECEWFYHVAWDLELVVLRPDSKTVAVLAATDTD